MAYLSEAIVLPVAMRTLAFEHFRTYPCASEQHPCTLQLLPETDVPVYAIKYSESTFTRAQQEYQIAIFRVVHSGKVYRPGASIKDMITHIPRLEATLIRDDVNIAGLYSLQVWLDSPQENTADPNLYYYLQYGQEPTAPQAAVVRVINRFSYVSAETNGNTQPAWPLVFQPFAERVAAAEAALGYNIPQQINWQTLLDTYLHGLRTNTLTASGIHHHSLNPLNSVR